MICPFFFIFEKCNSVVGIYGNWTKPGFRKIRRKANLLEERTWEMLYFGAVVLILLWVYLLWVFKRSKLNFWFFIVGCFGLFLILMILVRPWLTMPLARCVGALAGVIGDLTGAFTAYFKYGVLFINTSAGAITLRIDMECSGIIEISVFLSLLAFFEVFDISERVLLAILGTIYTILSNALRIIIICLMVRAFGMNVYYVAHTFIGRIVFYVLQVLLYFYVFTKPQIVKMQIGKFGFEKKKSDSAGGSKGQE